VDCIKNANKLILFFIHKEVDMKKLWLVVGVTVIAAMLSVSVWAEAPAPVAAAPAAAGATSGLHPCHAIEAACKAAGFLKGGAAQGKGLWKDCIQPILAGTAVSGVSVSAEDVQACKAKKIEKHH
jgi:hypothetical protein